MILVPQPGIEPVLPALEVWSLNHWTAREVSKFNLFSQEYVVCLWSRQLQTALFTAAPPKVSSTQLLGCAWVPFGEEGPHKEK